MDNLHNRNFETEEIVINRTRTITYGYTEQQWEPVSVEQILTVLEIYDIAHEIECIQKLFINDKPVYEITFTNEESRANAEQKLKGKIPINNTTLNQLDNRKLKNNIQIPLILVTLFETPAELNNEKILNKLKEYGDIKNDVYHHKIRNTNILNGYRTVYFRKINKTIPTVLWISGNRIKIRYDGQDRTPICSFCKVKGHYRDICETLIEINRKKEELQKEMEEEEEIENQRLLECETNWAKAVEEKEKQENKKNYSEIVSSNSTKPSSRQQFQVEMRKHREKTGTTKKKDDLSQRMAEIEQYDKQNVKRHIDKDEKQLLEEQEKKKKRKEAKKKRQQDRKDGKTTSDSESEMLHEWDNSNENFSV